MGKIYVYIGTHIPGQLAWSVGRQRLGAVPHSSHELVERLQRLATFAMILQRLQHHKHCPGNKYYQYMITLTFGSIIDVVGDKPCQSEVGDFDDVMVADEDVSSAHVSVNVLLFFEVMHCVCDLQHTYIQSSTSVTLPARANDDDDDDRCLVDGRIFPGVDKLGVWGRKSQRYPVMHPRWGLGQSHAYGLNKDCQSR